MVDGVMYHHLHVETTVANHAHRTRAALKRLLEARERQEALEEAVWG